MDSYSGKDMSGFMVDPDTLSVPKYVAKLARAKGSVLPLIGLGKVMPPDCGL